MIKTKFGENRWWDPVRPTDDSAIKAPSWSQGKLGAETPARAGNSTKLDVDSSKDDANLNRAGKKRSRRLTRCLSAPPSTGLSPGTFSAPLPMAMSSSMVASVSSPSLSASSGSPMVTPHHEAGLADISDAAGHRTAKTENLTKFDDNTRLGDGHFDDPFRLPVLGYHKAEYNKNVMPWMRLAGLPPA